MTSPFLLIMKERQGGISIIGVDAELAQKLSRGDLIKEVLPGAEDLFRRVLLPALLK